MDGWNTTFLLGPGLFSGAFAVSFREGNSSFVMNDTHPPGERLLVVHVNPNPTNHPFTQLTRFHVSTFSQLKEK